MLDYYTNSSEPNSGRYVIADTLRLIDFLINTATLQTTLSYIQFLIVRGIPPPPQSII